MPSSYAELRAGLDAARSRGQNFEDLPQYVRYLVGDNPALMAEYGAGAEDGVLKKLNYGVNQAIEFTGLPGAGESFGRAVGGALGSEEVGAHAGSKIARGAANLVPMLATGGASLVPRLLGLLGSGTAAGVDVYGEGGTGGQAIATGLLTAAIPTIAGAGSRFGAYLSGAPKVTGIATAATPSVFGAAGTLVNTRLPQTLGQRIAAYTGGQTAALVPFGAMESIEASMNGQASPVFSKDWWVGTLIGQVPFMAADIPAVTRKGPNATLVQGTLTDKPITPVVPPVTQPTPVVVNPEVVAKGDELLATMKAKSEINARTDLDAASKALLIQSIDLQQNKALTTPTGGPKPVTQLGTTLQPRVDEVTFSGNTVLELPANPSNPRSTGAWLVEVQTANKLGYVGKTMHVPKHVAKVNEDGSITIPTRFFNEARTQERATVQDPNTPELPVQETPGEIKPGPANETLTGAKGDLPLSNDPDWHTPIPELVERLKQATAKYEAVERLKTVVPETPVDSLETAKAIVVAADNINSQLDNSVPPVSDPVLAKDIGMQVSKGESLSDATTVAIESQKVKAVDRIHTEQQKLSRSQRKLLRQVEVAQEYGAIEEQVRTYKVEADKGDETGVEVQRPSEADELTIIENAIEQHGSKSGARMEEFVDELKAAYLRWRKSTKPGLEQGQVGKSLGAMVKTVLRRHEQGKVITGGKVLRKNDAWTSEGKKGDTQLFDTREAADTALNYHKQLDEGLQNPKVMSRRAKDGSTKYFLMERPRQQSVEFDPSTERTDTAVVANKAIKLPKAPTETTKVAENLPKVELARQAQNEITLALTKDDVRQVLAEYEEVVTEDYVDKAVGRLAVLNQAFLDKKIPAVLKKASDGEIYQALLKEQGLEFESVDAAQDFSFSDVVQGLRLRVAEQLKDVAMAPELPTIDQGIIDALGANDPVGYLEKMVGRSDPNGTTGALGKILLNYKDVLKGVKVNIVQGSGRARYNPATDTIDIGSGYLGNVRKSDYAFTHELSHALSLKLIQQNPNHPAVLEIERLRQHAINALPEDIRTVLNHWEDSKIYDKHAQGLEVDWGIDTANPWYNILYALHSNSEFVAQTYSDPYVHGYLSTVKVPAQKRTFVKWFTDTIAKLFGKSDHAQLSNLLEQSIVASNRVFDTQRSYIHFQNIAKQALLNQGMDPNRIAVRLRSFADMNEFAPVGGKLEQTREYLNWVNEQFKLDRGSGSLTPLEMQANEIATKQWRAMEETERAEQMELLREVKIQVSEDFQDSFTGVLGVDNLPEEFWINMHPASLRQLEAQARYGGTQMDILAQQEKAAELGLTNVRPAHNLDAINAAKEKFDGLLKTVRKYQRDGEDVLSFNRLTADGFIATMQNGEAAYAIGAEDVVGDLIGMPEKGKEYGWFSRNIMPVWQVAMEHPHLKPALGAMFDYRAMNSQDANRVFAHFSMKVGEDGVADFNQETQRQAERFISERSDLAQKVGDLMLLRQDKKDFLDSTDPKDRAAMEDVLQGLSQEDRNSVIDFAERQIRSTMEGQAMVVEKNRHLETNALAALFQRGSTVGVEKNKQYASQLMQAVEMFNDPATLPQGQLMVDALRAELTPEMFVAGLQYAQGAVARVTNLNKFFEGRQWFATEQSFDRWHITVRQTNGKLGRAFGDTFEQAKANASRMFPGSRVLKTVDKQDKNDPNRTYGVPMKVIEAVEAAENQRMQQLQQMGVDPEVLQVWLASSAASSLRKELAASQLYKPGSERAGVAGREQLPMLANHFNYHTALIRAMNAKVVRSETELSLLSPELAAKKDSVVLVRKALENFMTPDSEFASNATRAIATYNLAYSLPNMLIEGTQGLLTHTAQLTAEGAGIIGSYRHYKNAIGEVMSWGKSGKWKSPEHEEFMRRYTQDLEVGYGAWDDSVANSEPIIQRAKDLQNARKPTSVGGFVKGALSAYGRLGMNLYGVMTHFNARVAGLMSFEFYKSQGLDFNTAYQKAREFNRTVNFSGGKAARPVGFFENKGGWRGASQFMYLFRGFTLGMWSTIGRHLKGGFSSRSTLSVPERLASRKAAVQLLGTMMALGGALGLPGVEAAIAVLEEGTDLKIREGIRTGVSSALGDPTLSEGFLMGIPNMLGVDAHSRVSLGGFPGLSSFEGFSLTDLAGPAYGLVERLALGAKKGMTEGMTPAASYVLPPGFRRLGELVQNDRLVTSSGKLVTEYSTGEKVALAVGFTPTRVSQMKEAERIRSRSEKIDAAQTSRERQQIAATVQSGDVAGARTQIKSRVLQGRSTYEEEARAVAKAVEDRSFPTELRDRPGESVSGLSQAFGFSNHVSEVQRLQLRNQVLQQLGLPVQVSARDLQRAQMVDQILQQNPRLSRYQAREMVQQAFSRELQPL